MWDLIARGIVLLITLPIHEFAHGWAATRLGDPTPREQGRLTLNPFKHLSLFGSMALLIVGFGWAKPVMVDPRNFRKPRRDMALTAFAGPFSNLLMGFVVLIIYRFLFNTLFIPQADYTAAMTVFSLIININIQLAVFNLIPIPPLDGSKILGFFLPERFAAFFARYERVVMVLLLVLIWTGYLSEPLFFLRGKLLDFLIFITDPIDMLFMAVRG